MNSGSRHASGELLRAYPAAGPVSDLQGAFLIAGTAGRELSLRLSELAALDGSVLLCGETGTGKTLLARELHARGPNPLRAPRVINCAALKDAVLADALAELDQPLPVEGPFARATVLLDEVGELSPWAQAVLLRKVQPGGHGTRTRFIAATHRNLDAMADTGTFSRELLARLSTYRIRLTPLRARPDAIAALGFHFLRVALRDAGKSFVSVDETFASQLEAYDWPGNVRELKNAMLHALAINESGTLSVADLPDPVRSLPHAARLL
jgi:DNA-binding NtrC family response regulator